MSILLLTKYKYSKQIIKIKQTKQLERVLMKKNLFFGIILSTFCLILAVDAIAEKSKVTFNLRVESQTIDPQLITGETGGAVAATCMEGLTRFGKKSGETVPGVAEKWETSEDGLNWTFHLRKNAKWSNGESVTANDFHFGFKRLFEPVTGAQYAYMFYYIDKAEEYNTGKIVDFSKVGIKVVDDYTLEFKLAKPCTFFTQLLAMSGAYPINEKFYEGIEGDDNYALEVDYMLYNGPWILQKWLPGNGGKFEFIKSPYYWNKENIKINELEYQLVSEYNTAANLYKNGQLDITMISGDQLELFKNDPELHHFADGGVWYLQFNTTSKFFKNQKIRKAFALAINRKVFCENIRKDSSIPAEAFVPPGTFGGDGKTFRDRFGDSYFKEDVIEAKKLLEEGLKEIGHTGPVEIKLLTGNNDVGRRDGQYLQEELRKNLGVNIILDQNTFQERLLKMQQNDFDFVYAGWGPDYNDPMTFLSLFMTGGGNNHGRYSEEEFDNLLEQANSSQDNDVRMKAMAKAENKLLTDMGIAPLYYSSRNWLIKPWLKDSIIRMTGPYVSFYWAYIQK